MFVVYFSLFPFQRNIREWLFVLWNEGNGGLVTNRQRKVHNFSVDDVFTAFHLQIFHSALFCFFDFARFPSANKKKESGKLLVVELFYYSNESVLISACCDVMLLFW